jgi:DNA-binding transcriptional ArsR family regulator
MIEGNRGGGGDRISRGQRAMAHRMRARLLVALQNRTASPSVLADEFEESIAVVSYHLRVLVEAGLARLVDTAPKRGALQHFYALAGDQPIGRSLMLAPEAAEALRSDLAEALRRAEQWPGDVPAVVVAHVGDPE